MREIMNMEKTGVQNNNYKIVLLSTMFDRTYENVVRFSSRAEQRQFFHIPSIFDNAVTCNFRMSSFLETQIVYNVPALSTYNIPQLLQQNYAIVQDIRNGVYYFYFVTSARQLSGTQIALGLELDVFQTYYLDVTFTSSSISRTHLDRFYVYTLNGTRVGSFYPLDTFGVNEDLIIPEDLPEPALRITRRDTIKLWYENNRTLSTINNDLNDIPAWIYVYLDKEALSQSGYIAHRTNDYNTEVFSNDRLRYSYPYVILAYPIGNIKELYLRTNIEVGYATYNISARDLPYILSNLAPYIYNIKLSSVAPFRIKCGTWSKVESGIQLEQNQDHENPNLPTYTYNVNFGVFGRSGSYGLLIDSINVNANITGKISPTQITSIGYQNPFTWRASDIIGSTKNPKYNPKLFSSKYRKLFIADGMGNRKDYDLQKATFLKTGISTFAANVTIIHGLSADTSKSVAALYGGIYSSNFLSSYACLIGDIDNSFPYATDQLKTFLANNKNFFLQRQANIDLASQKAALSMVNRLVGSFGSGFAAGAANNSKQPLTTYGTASAAAGMVSGLTQTVTGAISDFATIENDLKQSNWQLDNLSAAPDALASASGNPFLTDQLENLKYVYEYEEALNVDLERANDYMCLFGYAYGKLGNIKDFDHSRKYYNYIRAAIEEINTPATFPVSVAVRDKFKEIFGRGVRLWHPQTRSDGSLTVTYSYEMENYERSLEA